MSFRLRHILLIFLLSGAASVSAQDSNQDDYYALILSYVDKIENIYNGNWAYSYTIVDRLEQETRTIRRDNSLPFLEREQLLAVNGHPPSEERLQEHREERERAQQRREERRAEEERARRAGREVEARDERDEKQRFVDMLIPESIHLISQEDGLLTLGFRAIEEEREKIYEYIRGTLVIDTDAGYIRELQVHVIEPFAPFFLSHVEDGFFSVRFELVDGVPMQKEVTWRLNGRAFFIRNLDADREISWMDLERINPELAENNQNSSDSSVN